MRIHKFACKDRARDRKAVASRPKPKNLALYGRSPRPNWGIYLMLMLLIFIKKGLREERKMLCGVQKPQSGCFRRDGAKNAAVLSELAVASRGDKAFWLDNTRITASQPKITASQCKDYGVAMQGLRCRNAKITAP